MKDTRVKERLDRIAALTSEGYAMKALAVVRQTKAEMLAAGLADPLLLGWIRYYEFRALYDVQGWKEIDELFRQPEPQTLSMPLKNAAWIQSVAGEAASRLGDAREVARRMEACYTMRLEDGDPVSAVQALQTACVLLARMGRPEMNTAFADRLIEAGLRFDATNAILQGLHLLADNYEKAPRTTVRRRLERGRTLLPSEVEPEFMEEARRVLERLRKLVD
ncbi:MAG TPA: hypothetical protein VEJ18_11250 [Planctomycetota bacterium]|nr:hypothetical protein [Planctomycetota bacterium]